MTIEDLDHRVLEWGPADPWERDLRLLLDRMDRDVKSIIVEGKNDRKALRAGGVESAMFECSRSRGLDRFAARITEEPIVILTDFDSHGRRLNGELRDRLRHRNIEPRYRRELGLLLTQRGRYDIESLNNVFRRPREL